MSGYVRIHRPLFEEHPAFRNDAEAMAFAWMIVKAQWQDKSVRYKGHKLSLKRGQLAVSQRDMATALDRDKAWIERLWKRLKSEAMIEVACEAGVAVITICKYNDYQADVAPREAAGEARETTPARQTQGRGEAQNNKGKEGNSSVSNDTGRADPVKEMFDLGVSLLTTTGTPEKQARSLLGKWKKTKGDAEVIQALLDCRNRNIAEPVEWLEKRFKGARYISKSGYEYRGSDEQILKECERRGDNDTYWAVKSAMKTRAA